ncbi:DUF6449 domain-containing protein [Lachnospiraceae bacterium 46-15]
MTSKISFYKLLKEDLKRRSWLIALGALACFILLPVVLLLSIDGMMDGVHSGYTELSYVQEYYMNAVRQGNGIGGVLAFGIAVIAGISGYSHLHSKVKLDFFHSLPISRKKYFFVQYVSGVIIFIAPFVVSMLLCLLVGAVNGLLTSSVALMAVKMTGFRILEYLAAYGTAILATVMTGKTLTAILGTAVFTVYIPAVLFVWAGMKSVFFETYVSGRAIEKFSMLFSPSLSGYCIESLIEVKEKWLVIGLGIQVFWIALVTGIALWLYCVRKTEAADHSMAFSKSESVVKVLLVIPMSLVAGLASWMIGVDGGMHWFFFGTVCAAVILSAVIEFIYHLNMRELFKNKISLILSVALSLGIALVFRYDIMGYDTYLPAREDVAQMALYDERLNGSFYYEVSKGGYDLYSVNAALDSTLLDNFAPIYELARKGAREENTGKCHSISVEYKLRNGRRERRNYIVAEKDIQETIKALFETPEFAEKIYPVFWRDVNLEGDINVSGLFGNVELKLNERECQEFLDIYREELRHISYDDYQSHVVGTIGFSVVIEEERGKYGLSTTSFGEEGHPICDSFQQTIAFLKDKAGIDLERRLAAKDVEKIVLTDFRDEGEGLITTVSDAEEIQKVLDCVEYCPLYSSWASIEEVNIEIVLKSGGMPAGSFYFLSGKLPDILTK